MHPSDISNASALAFFCAAVLGGLISGAFNHWLEGEPREPVMRARWRVGPRRLMERMRRELAAHERGRRT